MRTVWEMQPSSQKFGGQPNDPSKSKLEWEWRKNVDCPNGSIPIKRPIITGHPVLRKNSSFAKLEDSAAGHQ
ncbi:hypothetical protein Ancab_029693, partial [Ancistrocladus abbreviatus]